jgi:hypothetical protein
MLVFNAIVNTNDIFIEASQINVKQVGWPNGKALDYESRDCRFDPCVDHSFAFFLLIAKFLLH